MRTSCLSCAQKHLSQALVLISEGQMGYPEHRILALGHMAEASDETILDFPELANAIREERLKYNDSVIKCILAEAELEMAQEEGDTTKTANATDKLLTLENVIYSPDIMQLIRLTMLAMKENHKEELRDGVDVPVEAPKLEKPKQERPKPSPKINKKKKKV